MEIVTQSLLAEHLTVYAIFREHGVRQLLVSLWVGTREGVQREGGAPYGAVAFTCILDLHARSTYLDHVPKLARCYINVPCCNHRADRIVYPPLEFPSL